MKLQNQTIKTPNSIFKILFGHNCKYDDTGIIGMKYGGQHYYFVKNLFGDVIEIWDANGTYVGGYGYDAYGNTKVEDSTAAKIATANPFRYRGYYQDGIGSTDSVYFDSGLYYLKSRYYDPSILSFISADDPTMALLGAGQIGGTNLYAYCNYDPINYTDPGGYGFGLTALGIILITTIISAVDGGISASVMGQDFWKGAGAGAIGGFFGGAVSLLPGVVGVLGGRALNTAIYGVLNEVFQNGNLNNMDWGFFAIDVLLDVAITGLYSDFISGLPNRVYASFINGSIDGFIDLIQAGVIYAPATQFRASNNGFSNQIAAQSSTNNAMNVSAKAYYAF